MSDIVFVVPRHFDQIKERDRKKVERERAASIWRNRPELNDHLFDRRADAEAFMVHRAKQLTEAAEVELKRAEARLKRVEAKYGGGK